jgi:cysteine desulfurase family protein
MVYFDNAATTFPKPEEVYSFTDSFYRECGVNVGRGQHKLANRASFLVSETRELLLELNHCPENQIVFTPTATEALNIILRGIYLGDNSNVYITPFEHNAVMRVLYYITEIKPINIIQLEFDHNSYAYDLEKIKYQFSDKPPNLVIMSHASNVCGLIAPIAEVSALSKKYNAVTVVDMCQTMGLIDTNLSELYVDYAVFAGHKLLYAPFGVAGFICSAEKHLKPLIYGGTGNNSAGKTLPDTMPERFEVGSQNIMAIAGLNASLKWIQKTGIFNIYETENRNHTRLVEILSSFNNIKTVVPYSKSDAIGIVSCVFDGYSSDNIGQILSDKNVAVRTGLHCAPDAHRFLGTFPNGTVRFSVSFFNTDDDFVALEEVLQYINENS